MHGPQFCADLHEVWHVGSLRSPGGHGGLMSAAHAPKQPSTDHAWQLSEVRL